MTNLTNTELQAAINDATSWRLEPFVEKHINALLAEQIRRLNAEDNAPKIQPAVEEWEYVLAYWNTVEMELRESTYNLINTPRVAINLDLVIESDEAETGKTYGIYKRPFKSGDWWKLISFSGGILPPTVEEIN